MSNAVIAGWPLRIDGFRLRAGILEQFDACVAGLKHHEPGCRILQASDLVGGFGAAFPSGSEYLAKAKEVAIETQRAFEVTGRNCSVMNAPNHSRSSARPELLD